MANVKTQKVVKTTLDTLEFGEIDAEKEGKYKKYPLPEGVHKEMMRADVLTIAMPSLVELVLTSLTSMVDQIMVGRLPGQLGVQALSAVGLCMNPKMILMTALMAINTGTTAVIARFRGMGNQEKANQTFRQSLLFNFMLSFVMMTLGVIFSRQLIGLIAGNGISRETVDYAVVYFKIQMYGFIPLMLTNAVTSTLRAIGDSKMPLFYNTVANVVNVFFNYCLIYGKFGMPFMGVAGASLATVIGQLVAFVIAFTIMLKKGRYVYLDFKEKFEFSKTIMSNVIGIGLPAMLEQICLRIGIIIYSRIVASLGDVAYATHQICMNIQSMTFMTGMAFANSATTLMGQSLGKRRLDMADNYTRMTRGMSFALSCVIGVGLALFGGKIVGIYNSTPEIIEIGGRLLLTVAFVQPFQSSQFVTAGALRGAGDTKFTATVIFVSTLIVRSAIGYLFVIVFNWGLIGAWFAIVVDQLLKTSMIFYRYQQGKWRFLKLAK
ncbi:MAG: MATE family efflux transporter [Oscillospiraceae bacterium]|nr:MATE family efflux transporter [Oscillospiraceae bacterium]